MADGAVSEGDPVAASRLGRSALARLGAAPDAISDPLIVVALDRLRTAGMQVDAPSLLDWYAQRSPHYGRENALRYRWELSWRAEPGHPLYRPPEGTLVHWRPGERNQLAKDPSAYGRRLMEPLTIAAHLRFWGGLAEAEPDTEVGSRAAGLLDEAQPTMEDDVASWFMALDPWRDTFGLWALSGDPHAVTRLRDLLFSIAVRYGGIAARDGVIRGTRFPFHEVPLVSASAHLASGLWRMGVYPTVIPSLMDLLHGSRVADGGWADGDQPTDVLTTLAAADVMARLDPSFDPQPTIAWFVRHQEPDGWWRALGPEVPWLTNAVLDWLDLAGRSFPDRFTWPSAPVWARDRLTGLTTVATLDELGHVFDGLPRLAAESIEVAFLDLAGFGEWNNAYGQSKGDELLTVLGRSLLEIDGVLPVRIGGDEFLILGKPGARGLSGRLDTWRHAWPERLAEASMPAAVAPRVLVGRDQAGRLRDLRQRLGDRIAPLKAECPNPPPTGVQVDL